MLETIVGVVTLIGAAYGFYAWLRQQIKKREKTGRSREIILPLSYKNKQIELTDDALRDILEAVRRDVLLGRAVVLKVQDSELIGVEKKISSFPPEQQTGIAQYLASAKRKMAIYEQMLRQLFAAGRLEMAANYFRGENDLVELVRGMLRLLTTAEVTGRTKFDVWQEQAPKICFGIYVSDEEKASILDKAGVKDENLLALGPGNLFACQLPPPIIVSHVLPRLFLEIATLEKPLEAAQEASAFMLSSYNVGLG